MRTRAYARNMHTRRTCTAAAVKWFSHVYTLTPTQLVNSS